MSRLGIFKNPSPKVRPTPQGAGSVVDPSKSKEDHPQRRPTQGTTLNLMEDLLSQ